MPPIGNIQPIINITLTFEPMMQINIFFTTMNFPSLYILVYFVTGSATTKNVGLVPS